MIVAAAKGAGVLVDVQFTNKNTTITAWNLMHTAKMLRANGGFAAKACA